MTRSFHPISIFCQEPYCKIIAYPNPTKRQVTSRLAELEKLGISKVSFSGTTRIGRLDILGKGYVGLVVAAKSGSKTVALKIRRLDSQRKSMKPEADLLNLANKAGVGPKMITVSRNFLVMEYLDGEILGSWAESLRARGDARRAKACVRKILKDCYSLDMNGLDHGELSSMAKHAVIGRKITLVDFESSSTKRRAANVTSATQGIFIGSGVSRGISRAYRLPEKKRIIALLREYKQDPNVKNFSGLLKVLKL